MEKNEMPGGKGWQIFPDVRKSCHDENIFVSLVFIHSLPNMCLLFPLFSSARSKSYPLLSLSASFSTFHMIFNGPCWCFWFSAMPQFKCKSYCLSPYVYELIELWLQYSYSPPSIKKFDNISIKTLLQALITSQLSMTLSSLTQRWEIKDWSQMPNHPRPVSSPGPQAVSLFVLTYHGFYLFFIWAVKMQVR